MYLNRTINAVLPAELPIINSWKQNRALCLGFRCKWLIFDAILIALFEISANLKNALLAG